MTVVVTDKDGDSGSASFEVTVRNVDPTVAIVTSDAVDVGGTPTFFGQVDEPLDLSAAVTDPGSDDLFLLWDWGDGETDTDDRYLTGPAVPDPFPSPKRLPRDLVSDQSHTWAEACLFELVVSAEDDDGGSGEDSTVVIIVDFADQARGAGYWLHQYRGTGQAHLDPDTLACYLTIVDHLSMVFDDLIEHDAVDILHPRGNGGDMTRLLDRQLLAAWLNLASGAIAWDEVVDTTGDGVPDTAFLTAVTTAESVRLDPTATKAELEVQKDILETINLKDG